jgi:hypothetical protein
VIAVAGIGAAVLAAAGRDDGDDSDPGAAAGGGTAGTIAGVDSAAATLTVETAEGDTVEARAGDDTTISGTVEGSVDDLGVGDDVVVVGESAEGTLAAGQVVAGGGGGVPGGGGLRGALVSGTVESMDEGSLTVRTSDDDESVIVTWSSATIVLVAEELSFDDLVAGDEVTITGETEDGVVDAVLIRRETGGGST